jgi:NTE family protein
MRRVGKENVAMPDDPHKDALRFESPVEPIDTGSPYEFPAKGIALCLSGGGYRAMLFHLGAVWRLNLAGYLPRLVRISSVSGGSITAAVLGSRWSRLGFDAAGVAEAFVAEVVDPLRQLAGRTIDVPAVLLGVLGPGSVAGRLAKAYGTHLFEDATLQNLPDKPRFVFNATNVQSGALWRFMKPYMRDYRVGEVRNPSIPLAEAVAASSAFPPFLSPLTMRIDPADFTPGSGRDLQRPPFTTRVVLTDGGVYDNLGLETAWKRYETVLVSDGGGKMGPEGAPKRDWARHTVRVLFMIDNQVRSLRVRQLIQSYALRRRLRDEGYDPGSDLYRLVTREGAYWGIRTNLADFGLPDALPCPFEQTSRLAELPTRLKALDKSTQERLINWGFAVCDAALRRYADPTLPAPVGFPYPEAGVG